MSPNGGGGVGEKAPCQLNPFRSRLNWTLFVVVHYRSTYILEVTCSVLSFCLFSVHSPATANSVEFVSLACNLSVHSYLRRAKCMRVPIYRIFLSVLHLLMTRFLPRLLGGTLWKFVVFIIIELAEPSFLAVLSSCCMQPCVYILGNSSTASSFAFAEPMNLPTPEPVRLRNLPFLFVNCYRVLIILIQNTTLRRTESLSTIHPTQSLLSSEWRLVAEGNGQLAGKGENYDDDVRMAKSGNVFVKAINILKFYSNGIPFCYYTSCPSSSRVPKIRSSCCCFRLLATWTMMMMMNGNSFCQHYTESWFPVNTHTIHRIRRYGWRDAMRSISTAAAAERFRMWL